MLEKEKVRKLILSMGADVCGFASAERFEYAEKGFSPVDVMPDCRSVISFGIALPRSLYDASSMLYGHFNYKCCEYIDKIGFDVSKLLEPEYNCKALPIPCDGPYDYWDEETKTGKGLISMKYAAVMCGVGCMGKNTLLINEWYGNRLILGAILLDAEVQSDEPAKNLCPPSCHKCIDVCPVGAIGNDGVTQKKCRENAYGENARGFSTVNCNICRRVCPNSLGKKR